MFVSIIAAMDRHGLIGNEHGLPWRLPRDLRRFRELTWGKPIIMGRTTFAHIGRPLPGRHNIVLSRRTDFAPEGCTVVRSLDEAMAAAGNAAEVFVIGGVTVYREALARCNRMHLTLVEGKFTGNAYFPVDLVRQDEWIVARQEAWEADASNPHSHRYLMVERVGMDGTFNLSHALAEPAATKMQRAGPRSSSDLGPAR